MQRPFPTADGVVVLVPSSPSLGGAARRRGVTPWEPASPPDTAPDGPGPGAQRVVHGHWLRHTYGVVLATGRWARLEALVGHVCFSRKWKLYQEKRVPCLNDVLICIFKA